jgi:hypothetical protein
MSVPSRTVELEADLNNFDPRLRRTALAELSGMAQSGGVSCNPETDVANLHAHTFFSFNAYGYSPCALAWLAKRQGFRLMGIVDFDVLDGVDEFLEACEILGVRGSAGMETRVFIPEFAAREINSPGEPGVAYHMGIGFTSSQVPAEAAPALADLRRRAGHRNRLVVERLNAFLAPIKIDYEADVIPLTPGGNPTERHIVLAYLDAAGRNHPDRIAFWSDKLGMLPAEVAGLLADSPKFQNLVRTRLMKRGGPGYIAPTAETFPSVAEAHRLILACGALPCFGWLDGTSQGERDIAELLELLVREGVVAVNIVPDRNWNIPDPQTRREKVQKLYEIVALAGDLDLPLNVGTEMNSFGQKHVDDFTANELLPVRQAFLDGAHFIYGHTVLQRALGLGYGSPWAQTHLPTRRERNRFFTQAGYRIPPGRENLEKLKTLGSAPDPEKLLSLFFGLFPSTQAR